MSANKVFFDSNLIAYLHSDTDKAKKLKVRKAFSDNDRYISTQVLNEFSNVAFKKLHLEAVVIDTIVDELASLCFVSAVDTSTVHKAISLKTRYGYSYYDSLMIASALDCKCDYLYSEDLQDGQIIDSLTIKNILL